MRKKIAKFALNKETLRQLTNLGNVRGGELISKGCDATVPCPPPTFVCPDSGGCTGGGGDSVIVTICLHQGCQGL
jgi:hypothetical protein